ncbi:hypothetical protein CBM2614_B150142 [Cupriavidus taiwanensis]|nr:hypothetical protein CBM2614_B150142 [Cupriavidus taiwanensis]
MTAIKKFYTLGFEHTMSVSDIPDLDACK